MKAIVRFVLLTALRDKFFSGLLGLLFMGILLSLFLGDAAIVEQRESGLVFLSGIARNGIVLGLLIFVAFQTQRLIESRELEAILSRQISRSQFVAAYWFGFAVVALLLIAPVSATLIVIYQLSGPILYWSLSLFVECIAILAFVILAALSLERSFSAIFVSIAFYALTRLIGFFLGIKEATPEIGANKIINPMIDVLAMIIPRLDLMSQSSWLVYGLDVAKGAGFVFAQCLVFVVLSLLAAAFDLRKKQF